MLDGRVHKQLVGAGPEEAVRLRSELARARKAQQDAEAALAKVVTAHAAASEARLRAEQGQFLGHPNPNALRSSNIQHPIYRRKGTLRSGVSPMGFGV